MAREILPPRQVSLRVLCVPDSRRVVHSIHCIPCIVHTVWCIVYTVYTRQSAVKTSFYFAPYSHLPHCSTLLRLGEAIPEKPFFLNQFFFFKQRLPLLIRFGHSPTIYSLKCKSKLSAHVQTDYYHNFFITSFTLVLIITGRAIACWLWETTTTLYSVTLLVST